MPYQNKRLNNIEDILHTYHRSYLKVLERVHGVEMQLLKPLEDVYDDVYGIDSGDMGADTVCITGIITGDEFSPSGNFSSGAFQTGWLYTSSKLAEVGDTVSILVNDNRSRRFKIEACEALGTTRDVFSKFRLAALGD